jgi:hypothetical protein
MNTNNTNIHITIKKEPKEEEEQSLSSTHTDHQQSSSSETPGQRKTIILYTLFLKLAKERILSPSSHP